MIRHQIACAIRANYLDLITDVAIADVIRANAGHGVAIVIGIHTLDGQRHISSNVQ